MSTGQTWQERAEGPRYLHRVLDDELDEKSAEFAAISIEGPKGVGKTETAQRRAKTDYRLDGPAGQVVAANPQVVLTGEPPILIDEWQRVPATWDVIRRAVDDGAPPSSYLLAGSASEHGAHTGAGRILTLRMRPLSLSERDIYTPTVSLRHDERSQRPSNPSHATPRDFAGLRYLRDKLNSRFKGGVVLYTGSDTLPFGDRLAAVPLSGLWSH